MKHTMFVLTSLKMIAGWARAGDQKTHCLPDETVVFSCQMESGGED